MGGFNRDNWYLVTNRDPAPPFSLKTSTYEEIETFFRWLGSMDYAVNEPLRAALTTNTPARILIDDPPPPMTAPFSDPLTGGWQGTDIAGSLAGGQRVLDGASMDIYGGGADLWGLQNSDGTVNKPSFTAYQQLGTGLLTPTPTPAPFNRLTVY